MKRLLITLLASLTLLSGCTLFGNKDLSKKELDDAKALFNSYNFDKMFSGDDIYFFKNINELGYLIVSESNESITLTIHNCCTYVKEKNEDKIKVFEGATGEREISFDSNIKSNLLDTVLDDKSISSELFSAEEIINEIFTLVP
jgi:hypothetical protein